MLGIRAGQPKPLIAHWAKMLSPARLEEVLDTQWGIVAIQDDEPVGFASLEGDNVLGMLYVHPAHQGTGIASALVGCVAEEAGRRGGSTLAVDASLNALKVYLRLGFAKGETKEKTDEQGVTYKVHRMEADLQSLLA